MLGARTLDAVRGYAVESIVYLYLLSILPLRQENPLKPLMDAARNQKSHLKELESFLRDASVTINVNMKPTVDAVLESSPALRRLVDAIAQARRYGGLDTPQFRRDLLTREYRDYVHYEHKEEDADLETEIAWRELIETMEHHVH